MANSNQIIARIADKWERLLTANQTTYEMRIIRKAHIKSGQTFGSRANDKPNEIIARKAHKKATDYNRAKNIHKYNCPQSPLEKRADVRSRANNKPKQIIARKAHKSGKSLTAGQKTYVNKTAREAHTKRRQTLRSRANNKSK